MANVLGGSEPSAKKLPKKKRSIVVGVARKKRSVWNKIVEARAAIIREAINTDEKFAKALQKAVLKGMR